MANRKPIDARLNYRPESIPALIEKAKPLVGGYVRLSHRLDYTDSYLRKVRRKESTGSYGLQIMLEAIIEQEGGEPE